jgi:DNA primase
MLLEIYIKQIQIRDKNIKEARIKKDRRYWKGKEQFDTTYQIRLKPISERDLVLIYNIKLMN